MRRTVLFAAIGALLAAPAMARNPLVDPNAPLSSMVAVRMTTPAVEAATIPQYVKSLVGMVASGTALPAGVEFPVANTTTDSVRTLAGTAHNVVVRWLDPLTADNRAEAPHFGANNDYIAYFGDGWDDDWANGDQVTRHPQFSGSGTSGWIWSNHEYVSNALPTAASAPTGQYLTLARYLKSAGVLTNDVEASTWSQADLDTLTYWAKKQIGGTWMRVVQDEASGEWRVDTSADNKRYDATDATITTITDFWTQEQDHDDLGRRLLDGLAVGIAGDCSGAQTPWGTIFSAEENVQDYYGDLEGTWSSNHKFLTGNGFDPGNYINPDVSPSEAGEFGRISDPNQRHNRDFYGFMVEMDPGQDGNFYYLSANLRNGDGLGHRKMGSMGRARWENAAVATEHSFYLVGGKPLVVYGGDDRRSGRIYKWVSRDDFNYGMTRAETRALLDTGYLYVAHFRGLDNRTGFTLYDPDCNANPPGLEAEIAATCTLATEEAPGVGQWIWLSVNNQFQEAPNAAALGRPGTTVGEALRDLSWNGIGGFRSDNDVKMALFTASMKLGVMELNRPEDLEWNPRFPGGGVIHVAFTNSGVQTGLDQWGVLFDPAVHATQSPKRIDGVGSIFTMREENASDPGNTEWFTYWMSWLGTRGNGPFDAANPDNLMIDSEGGVWFGTDGNFGRNKTADALYYLDLDAEHKRSAVPTYGKAFRVVAGPSDAEVTGPAFNATQTTLFFNAQHPGENVPSVVSTWPQE